MSVHPLSDLGKAVREMRLEWQTTHGKCTMCDVEDGPLLGLHRGGIVCGNIYACRLCVGCLPINEICKNCHRKNIKGNGAKQVLAQHLQGPQYPGKCNTITNAKW